MNVVRVLWPSLAINLFFCTVVHASQDVRPQMPQEAKAAKDSYAFKAVKKQKQPPPKKSKPTSQKYVEPDLKTLGLGCASGEDK
jgi:hypothetical protein